ncbi:hypothetical protein ACL02S_23460 [Nocardia sp. 004]|uniref:hypothetical protein n=1 Tax=Nocardia sp. 004 TaxID=3385978 RepID=UPI0039A280A9
MCRGALRSIRRVSNTFRYRRSHRGPLGRLVSLVLRTPVVLVVGFFATAFLLPALLLTANRGPAPEATAAPVIDHSGCVMFCTDTEYATTPATHVVTRVAVYPDPSACGTTDVLFSTDSSGRWPSTL